MKTKCFKNSTIGAIAAALLATSGLATADPIWAGHFKEAYSSTSPQTDKSMVRSNTTSVKERLIWAGHFEQAYDGSSQGASVATRTDAGKYLLWAGHFKQAYQPAEERTVEFAAIDR